MISTNSRLRGQRIDRYLALAACAGAGGVAATEAEAAIVRSNPGWSAAASRAGDLNGIAAVSAFGTGASALDGVFKFGANALTSSSGPFLRGVSFGGLGFKDAAMHNRRLVSGDSVSGPLGWTGLLGGNGTNLVASMFGASGFAAADAPWGQLGVGTVDNSLRGFVGFRFKLAPSADFSYGYFDITVFRSGTGTSTAIGFTLHGWAYNSTPGESITIGGVTPIPGSTGLVALAIGAAGLRGRRRSRR